MTKDNLNYAGIAVGIVLIFCMGGSGARAGRGSVGAPPGLRDRESPRLPSVGHLAQVGGGCPVPGEHASGSLVRAKACSGRFQSWEGGDCLDATQGGHPAWDAIQLADVPHNP